MKWLRWYTIGMAFVAIISLGTPYSIAQTIRSRQELCLDAMEQALSKTDALCERTGRHEACYGNVQVSATSQLSGGSLNFDEPGDIVDLLEVRSLQLSPMSESQDIWGIVEMRVQASIPTSRPENVSLLLFGDAQINNIVESSHLIAVTPTSATVNIYASPSETAEVIDQLSAASTLNADARLEESNWYRLDLGDQAGWVLASEVELDETPDHLPIVEAETSAYRPMQAFYFQTGQNNNICGNVPADGLLIQTPEGVGQVTFLINEVTIHLGSTAFIQAEQGGEMTIQLLEGHSTVEAFDVQQTLLPGTQVTIPLSDTLSPTAPPTAPESYKENNTLPLAQHLDEPVVIAPVFNNSAASLETRLGTEADPAGATTQQGAFQSENNGGNQAGDPNGSTFGTEGSSNGNGNSNGNVNVNGTASTTGNGGGTGSSDGSGNGSANGNSNGSSNGDGNGNANGNGNGNGNSNGNGNGNANGNSNGNGNGNSNGNSNGNGNGNGGGNLIENIVGPVVDTGTGIVTGLLGGLRGLLE